MDFLKKGTILYCFILIISMMKINSEKHHFPIVKSFANACRGLSNRMNMTCNNGEQLAWELTSGYTSMAIHALPGIYSASECRRACYDLKICTIATYENGGRQCFVFKKFIPQLRNGSEIAVLSCCKIENPPYLAREIVYPSLNSKIDKCVPIQNRKEKCDNPKWMKYTNYLSIRDEIMAYRGMQEHVCRKKCNENIYCIAFSYGQGGFCTLRHNLTSLDKMVSYNTYQLMCCQFVENVTFDLLVERSSSGNSCNRITFPKADYVALRWQIGGNDIDTFDLIDRIILSNAQDVGKYNKRSSLSALAVKYNFETFTLSSWAEKNQTSREQLSTIKENSVPVCKEISSSYKVLNTWNFSLDNENFKENIENFCRRVDQSAFKGLVAINVANEYCFLPKKDFIVLINFNSGKTIKESFKAVLPCLVHETCPRLICIKNGSCLSFAYNYSLLNTFTPTEKYFLFILMSCANQTKTIWINDSNCSVLRNFQMLNNDKFHKIPTDLLKQLNFKFGDVFQHFLFNNFDKVNQTGGCTFKGFYNIRFN